MHQLSETVHGNWISAGKIETQYYWISNNTTVWLLIFAMFKFSWDLKFHGFHGSYSQENTKFYIQ